MGNKLGRDNTSYFDLCDINNDYMSLLSEKLTSSIQSRNDVNFHLITVHDKSIPKGDEIEIAYIYVNENVDSERKVLNITKSLSLYLLDKIKTMLEYIRKFYIFENPTFKLYFNKSKRSIRLTHTALIVNTTYAYLEQ